MGYLFKVVIGCAWFLRPESLRDSGKIAYESPFAKNAKTWSKRDKIADLGQTQTFPLCIVHY